MIPGQNLLRGEGEGGGFREGFGPALVWVSWGAASTAARTVVSWPVPSAATTASSFNWAAGDAERAATVNAKTRAKKERRSERGRIWPQKKAG